MNRELAPLVAIVGPTGSGKSTLALKLAEAVGGEIVGCDALQIYRELEIGTAKPSEEERARVPHHLMDCVWPNEEFSAADYVARAAPAIEGIRDRGRRPLLVGGTGLYLRALRFGLFEGPGRSESIRARLRAIASRRGAARLYRLLKRWDPRSADRIHPNDQVRIIRALEVRVASGEPMSVLMERRKSPIAGFQVILVGLSPERSELRARIVRRAQEMIAQGFIEEVRELRHRYGDDIPAFKAIGYREALEHLDGEIDDEELRESLIRSTTRYAKRQMTWFRREAGMHWFHGCGDEQSTLRDVLSYLGDDQPGKNLELRHAKTAP